MNLRVGRGILTEPIGSLTIPDRLCGTRRPTEPKGSWFQCVRTSKRGLPRKLPANRRRAFTLIELLVVVAIIAVLAALLLPVLSRAKQASHSAVCRNNLRQWGIALRLYLDDYTAFPPYQLAAPPGQLTLWHSFLLKGVGMPDLPWESGGPVMGESAQIQVCPGLVRTTRLAYMGGGGQEAHGLGSYGYNLYGVRITPNGMELGLGGKVPNPNRVPTGQGDFRPIRENEAVNPSDLIAVGDAIVHSIYWEGADYSDAAWPWDGLAPDYIEITSVLGMKPSTWSPPTAHTAADVKAMRAVLQRRHGGKWNVLFCDGHVESLTTPNLFDTRKASVRMRWNNDNLPDH